MALWCVGFAGVNVGLEITGDHLSGSPYAAYAAGFTVMNWLVVALKLVGAATALLSVTSSRSVVARKVVAVSLGGAFGTLALYALGSVVQAVGMITGLMGDLGDIDPAGLAYLVVFLPAAAGFGILATSYARRQNVHHGFVLLGVLGAPMVLGLVLLVVPIVLVALGMLPAT